MSGKPSSLHAEHRPPHLTKYSAPDRRQWERYVFTLTWLYGAERAEAIVSGRDEASEVDARAWRELGTHK